MTTNNSNVSPRRQRIKFTADWDKLKLPRFTTIRTYKPEKEQFYRSHKGEVFTILRVPHEWSVRGHKVGEATLLTVERVNPSRLSLPLLLEDIKINGKPEPGWLARIGEMGDGLLLTFENHTGILK